MDAYLGLGAPAPEADATHDDTGLALDIDWSSGWETEPPDVVEEIPED